MIGPTPATVTEPSLFASIPFSDSAAPKTLLFLRTDEDGLVVDRKRRRACRDDGERRRNLEFGLHVHGLGL